MPRRFQLVCIRLESGPLSMLATQAVSLFSARMSTATSRSDMRAAKLSFDVRVARTEAELAEACQVRAQAYGHHLGEAVAHFAEVEALDRSLHTTVLLVRDKASGQAIGTARIQASRRQPLVIEGSVALPRAMATQPRAEVTRLAVLSGTDPMVKLAIMKAVYHFCLAQGIRWLVIGARCEALARGYRHLGFEHFLPAGQMVPLAHAGAMRAVILTMDVQAARQYWEEGGHRLQAFMLGTAHQDMPVLEAARPAQSGQPRPLRMRQMPRL